MSLIISLFKTPYLRGKSVSKELPISSLYLYISKNPQPQRDNAFSSFLCNFSKVNPHLTRANEKLCEYFHVMLFYFVKVRCDADSHVFKPYCCSSLQAWCLTCVKNRNLLLLNKANLNQNMSHILKFLSLGFNFTKK